jgi:hypothetical protein
MPLSVIPPKLQLMRRVERNRRTDMTGKNRNLQGDDNEENFYEALGAAEQRYQFHEPEVDRDELYYQSSATRDAKITAIITIALVVLVAVLLSIFLLSGLQTVKDNMPSNATTHATAP